MKLSDYDYDLPADRIAQYPLPVRDQSRLMVLHRSTGEVEHAHFRCIGEYLRSGDCLVLNETKVFPARLMGCKEGTGGSAELFLLRCPGDPSLWAGLVRPGRRVRPGSWPPRCVLDILVASCYLGHDADSDPRHQSQRLE